MLLRNGKQIGVNIKIYDVDIDFDEASKEWRKNKISLGGGLFQYK